MKNTKITIELTKNEIIYKNDNGDFLSTNKNVKNLKNIINYASNELKKEINKEPKPY